MRCSHGLYKLMLRSLVCIAISIFGVQTAWGQNNSCIEVAPDSLDFYGDLCNDWIYQENIEFQAIHIMSLCGDTGLYWEVSADSEWVGVAPPYGWDSDTVLVWIAKEHLTNLPDFLPPGDTLVMESIVSISTGDPAIPPEYVVVRLHLACTPFDPLLVVQPSQLSFEAAPGDTLFDSLFVYEAHGDTIMFSFYNSSSWLILPYYFAPVYTPMSLPVYVNTSGLAPGTYLDSIFIFAYQDSAGPPFQTVVVPVTLHVQGDGDGYVVETIPSEFSFVMSSGEGFSDSLHIFEVNGHNVPFMHSNTHPWLVVDPFSMPPYVTPMTFTVVAGAYNLPPGNYVDTIVIKPLDPDFDFDTVWVPVFVAVYDSPNLEASPDHFEFVVQPGDVIPHRGIAVWETHGDTLPFAAEVMHGSFWLDIESTRPSDIYFTPDSVFFGIYANNLGPGYYADTIRLYAPYDSIPFPDVLILVWLSVDSSGYQLVVDPMEFEYTRPMGHYWFDYLSIEELHGDTLLLSFMHTQPWLSIPEFFVQPTTPMTLEFGIITEGLAPGTYQDVLTIAGYAEAVDPVDVVHVPITLVVTDDQPFTVLAAPNHFELTWTEGNYFFSREFLVYDLDSANLTFATSLVNNSSWLTLDSSTAFGVTPSHVGFYINTAGLAPGAYGDSILIYYPLDDMYGFDDVIVPVILYILPDSLDAIVATDPEALQFSVQQGGQATLDLRVFEIHGGWAPFHIWNSQPWLQHSDFCGIMPHYTPDTLLFVVTPDSLPPGWYADTIFIVPDTDGVSFPPVAVPVGMHVLPPGSDYFDSLIIPSVTVTPCDWGCAVQPVQTKLMQPIKGATIPISIPDGVSICSLSTDGLLTDGWDWNFVEVNDSSDGQGYLFVALANSFDSTIPPGVSTVFNIHFNVAPGCSDAAYFRWDTTLMLDVSKRLAFTDITYETVHPGFDYMRDRVEIVGYAPGDFDDDSQITISDLVGVVDYMFTYGPPPCVINALDVNGDCIGPDISDLIFLIDWMFLPWDPPPIFPPVLNCGCITSDGAAVAKPNPEIILSAVYENGVTDIILNSPIDLRGLQLHLRGDGASAPQKLIGAELDLVHGVRDDNIRIGILDLDGANVIASGETAVVRLVGRVELIEAVVTDDRYGSMQASVERVGGSWPDEYSLSQNYPNPFNPITEISFTLPHPSQVSLQIYNVVGQKVVTLYSGHCDAGVHSVLWDAREMSSGVYFYRLTTPEFEAARKMVLLK